jgi:hypothetical protein
MKPLSTSLGIVAPLAAALVLLSSSTGRAQSLADLARAEAARRAAVENPSPTIKKEDLKPVPPPAARPAAPVPPKSAEAAEAEQDPAQQGANANGAETSSEAGDPAKPREKRDEAYWRKRFTDTRGAVNRANEDAAAVQARIAAIDADLQNPALPPARQSTLQAERDRARAAIARFQQQAQELGGELANLEQRARELNVNPDWMK